MDFCNGMCIFFATRTHQNCSNYSLGTHFCSGVLLYRPLPPRGGRGAKIIQGGMKPPPRNHSHAIPGCLYYTATFNTFCKKGARNTTDIEVQMLELCDTRVRGCSKHSGSQFTQLSQLRLMEINIKFTLIQSWGTSLISVYLALRWYQPCTLNLVALGRFYIPSNASSCWWWLNVKSLPNSNQRRALSQQFIKWLHSFAHQKKLTTTQWTNIDLLTRLSTFSNAAKCPNYSQQPVQGY